MVDGLEPPSPKDLIYSQASQPIAQHHNVVLGTGFEPVTFPVKGGCPKPARRTERLKKKAYSVHIFHYKK